MLRFTIAPDVRSTDTLFEPVDGVIIPANASGATVQLTMPIDAERASTSNHVDFGVELLIAPSTTWKPYLMAGWNGGSGTTAKNSTVLNPPPNASIGGDFFASFEGNFARLRLQTINPMTIGATITVV